MTAAGRPPLLSAQDQRDAVMCVLLGAARCAAAASRSAPLRSARLGPPLGGTVRGQAGRRPLSQTTAHPAALHADHSGRAPSSSAGRMVMPLVSRTAVQWATIRFHFRLLSARSSSVCGAFGRPFLPRPRTFRAEGPALITSSDSSNSGGSAAAVSAHRCGGSLCALPAAGRIDFSAAEGRGAAGRGRSAAECGGRRLREPAPSRPGASAMATARQQQQQQQRAGRLAAANDSGSD